MKKVGRVGLKALIYFEVVTTLALVIGLVIVNVLRPGAGMNVDPATLDAKAIASLREGGQPSSRHRRLPACTSSPTTVVGAFAEGEILQVLFFAILFGFALHSAGRARQAAARAHRQAGARLVRHRRHHHAARADRRVRRDGVHRRQVRPRHAALARRADGVRSTRPACSSSSCVLGAIARLRGFSILQVHPLHPRGAADRARAPRRRNRCCRG